MARATMIKVNFDSPFAWAKEQAARSHKELLQGQRQESALLQSTFKQEAGRQENERKFAQKQELLQQKQAGAAASGRRGGRSSTSNSTDATGAGNGGLQAQLNAATTEAEIDSILSGHVVPVSTSLLGEIGISPAYRDYQVDLSRRQVGRYSNQQAVLTEEARTRYRAEQVARLATAQAAQQTTNQTQTPTENGSVTTGNVRVYRDAEGNIQEEILDGN